jgi:hypothetical protein
MAARETPKAARTSTASASPIIQRMSELYSVTNLAHKLASELMERLAVILGPESPTSVSDKKDVQAPYSGLESQIMDNLNELNYTNSILQDAIDRLQL